MSNDYDELRRALEHEPEAMDPELYGDRYTYVHGDFSRIDLNKQQDAFLRRHLGGEAMMDWTNLYKKDPWSSDHYSISRLSNPETGGMAELRAIFPEGEANELNFVLFSTSGVHGHYGTIEDAEQRVLHGVEDESGDVTFVVVHPRIVHLRYGNCEPRTPEDFAFLKKLRASSYAAVMTIGAAAIGKAEGGGEGGKDVATPDRS